MESDCRGGHETPRVRDADRDAMLRGPGVARLHPGAIGDDGVRLMSYVTVPHPDGGYHRIAVRTHVPTD